MTASRPPGAVGWTKTANVKSDPSSPAGTGRVADEPLGRSWWRPGRTPSIVDGTRTCLKPGPAGLVSPWMSRTSRLAYRSWSELTMNRIVSPGAALRRSV